MFIILKNDEINFLIQNHLYRCGEIQAAFAELKSQIARSISKQQVQKLAKYYSNTSLESTMSFDDFYPLTICMISEIAGTRSLFVKVSNTLEKLLEEPLTTKESFFTNLKMEIDDVFNSTCTEDMKKTICQTNDIGCNIKSKELAVEMKFISKIFSAKASTLLAYFGSFKGSYFSHKQDNLSAILSKEETGFDKTLNKFMMKITNILSNGVLKNISIIDLPSYGSNLLKDYETGDWFSQPTATFQNILKSFGKSPTDFIEFHSKFLNSWKFHEGEPFLENTSMPMKNDMLNFTKYITQDFKTFLMSYIETFPTPKGILKDDFWKNVSKSIFSDISTPKLSIFDNLLFLCTFRESVTNLINQRPNPDSEFKKFLGGCEKWKPVLTSNGVCHSFNKIVENSLWRDSAITKAMEKLQGSTFSQKYFRGIGSSEGETF